MISEMGAFVHGHVRRGALVAAALVVFAARAAAQSGSGGSTAGTGGRGGGGSAAVDGGKTNPDGGKIVDTYIDPGCGCRVSLEPGGARSLVAALGFCALLVTRRQQRLRHKR